MSSRHVVATIDEIEPGKSKRVTVKGRDIGVFNVNGTYYALRNLCPHKSGPLCTGRVSGRVVADASTYRTPDVSTALLNAGLARRYAGGRRETWCS